MKPISTILAASAMLLWPATLVDAEVITRSATADVPTYPKRVISINPCADALLMQLADKHQIKSISHYSHDERATSIGLSLARQFPATSGTAEEILAMRPDLVVAGSHIAIPTERALDRLGIPLIKLSIPQSVAESQQQITELSEIVGAPRRGIRLNKSITAAFAKAKPADDKLIPALIWRSGGLVPGAGTLPGELLRRTGFENVSKSYGLKQWDILPLEHLVARPPRLLFSNNAEVKGSRYSDRLLSHPVLKSLSHRITVADYPARLLHCAGPTLIEAVGTLSAARRQLETR
ncbi:ABC transporter substrate-binding protein [Parasphingorhabdus sp.]|uniref:ABC transporter substrate-binding protein n=1 Tax=Parasphingorhabdus sp. TaxID=2709688 RepID=UPI0032677D82